MKLIPVLLSVAFVAAVCALAAHDETPELPPEYEDQAVEEMPELPPDNEDQAVEEMPELPPDNEDQAVEETPELPPEYEDQAVEDLASSMTEGQQKRTLGAIIRIAAKLVGTGAKIWSAVSGLGRAVAVKNHLGYSIMLKCASGDDDLGWQTLQHGHAFMFNFRANIFGRTHFWCTVRGKGRTFPVYNEGAPSGKRNVYNLRLEGIYYTDNLDSDKGIWFRGWN